jgi:hypothetical protein
MVDSSESTSILFKTKTIKTMENYTIIEGNNIDLAIQYWTMKKEGKDVKVKYLNEAGNWCNDGLPDFDDEFKYRLLIPKEKKLVPFDFSDNLIGMVVEDKMNGFRAIIYYQGKGCVKIGSGNCGYKELLEHFTIYPSGEPCGKEELL